MDRSWSEILGTARCRVVAEPALNPGRVPTVFGAPIQVAASNLVDGHEHAWIAPQPGTAPDHAIDLSDVELQAASLKDFAKAASKWWGHPTSGVVDPLDDRRVGLVDCQPPFAGRDARRLAELSQRSGVAIACVTGFHLARYYPDGQRPWGDEAAAADLFEREIELGLTEMPTQRAAAIKAAHSGTTFDDLAMWEAATEAQRRTDACLLVHTERGAGVTELLAWLVNQGVDTRRVYLCHMDKRPDIGLHRELAQSGVLLGYDTFLRAKYEPDKHVWPLLLKMLELGFGGFVALGLDLAGADLWRSPCGGPSEFVTNVATRVELEVSELSVRSGILGANVVRRLARGLEEG